ncbi:uncharacterized protein LOC113153516 [Anabas testudineus]|uniref:uncharacterized protein LOC113153516 n=1 Tax=Anabas testudineus TaxID=64144 RepID=UPI000E45E866|nr:uncharacterized protein LOC113153516 [Anabas testudineus]
MILVSPICPDDEVFQTFTQTTSRTAETTITCENTGNKHDVQVFCKENDFICEEILSTTSVSKSNGTFTLIKSNSGFNISISDVSSQDAGVYWCGGKSNDGNYRAGLRKIQLEVKASVSPTQSTSTKTPGGKPTAGRSYITVTVVFVALLVFLIILVVVYKRIKSQISKESQTNKEDHYYEEIQERPHKSDSRTAMKMVYATANFPTNPSDIIDDSTVTANNIYCTVGEHEQHSTYSTVNNSTVFSENPLYYTVNLPQKV